jgi:hypothetical protein
MNICNLQYFMKDAKRTAVPLKIVLAKSMATLFRLPIVS